MVSQATGTTFTQQDKLDERVKTIETEITLMKVTAASASTAAPVRSRPGYSTLSPCAPLPHAAYPSHPRTSPGIDLKAAYAAGGCGKREPANEQCFSYLL